MMYNVLLSLSLLYLLLVVVVLAVGAVATTATTNSVSLSSSTASTSTTNDNYDSNNNNNNVECRSNTTHIAWRSKPHYGQKQQQQQQESSYYVTTTTVHQEQQVQQEQRLLDTIVLNEENGNDNDEDIVCTWETIEEAYLSAQNYLHRNIFQFDLPFQSTLGFPVDKGTDNDDDDDDVLPDGLGDGIVNGTLVYAFRAKEIFAYTDIIERSIFYEYILPYAFLNEGRTNWRPYLWDHLIEPVLLLQSSSLSSSSSKKANIQQQQQQQQQQQKDESDQNEDNNNNNLQSIVDKANQLNYTINDVVRILNTHMWNVLAPASAVDTGGIVFKSGQAPTILDPMSVLVFGYGSCTALSILFCCALRTAGIPCRIAGTPAWYQNRSQGNHNWVEIYTNQQWYFIESSPAALAIDTIERNPCHRWFCTKDRYTNNTTTTTKVYSAKLDTTTNTDTFFRLAWEWSNQDIPAIDQTNYYYTICSQC